MFLWLRSLPQDSGNSAPQDRVPGVEVLRESTAPSRGQLSHGLWGFRRHISVWDHSGPHLPPPIPAAAGSHMA